MKWIGLTGGIATGKSTVSKILKANGVPVVDADEIAHAVVELGRPGLQQVVSQFGKEVLKADGSLDRRKLGQAVFGNPGKLLQLENILHPLIQAETAALRKKYHDSGESFAIYDVPLLFEKKLEAHFDAIIVVTSSEEIQKSRMRQRDSLSEGEIHNRLKSQVPLSEKIRKANWVIKNEGSVQELESEVLKLLKKIQSGKE
jgi:dephospho-CoA kinase